MKLGVSYNVFDGAEHLHESITRIKPEVDYISLVVQRTSNYGTSITSCTLDIISNLIREKLVDDVFFIDDHIKTKDMFNKLELSVHAKEQFKRNIGLGLAKDKGCTHFMSMDCDEYYNSLQFSKAKTLIESGGYTNSACNMLTYYGDKNHILADRETYFVPFICQIFPQSVYLFTSAYPYYCDPTRRIQLSCDQYEKVYERVKIFTPNELLMHHMSYVRNDMLSKLSNSSARVNWPEYSINKVVKYHSQWMNNDPTIDKNYGMFTDGLKLLEKIN